MDFLLQPLAWVLQQISYLFGNNYAASIFVFTIFINVIMIPLSIKSQKSSMGQTRIKPKLDALKQKYGDDRQKFAMAQQELMQKEGVSMSGGCLPLLIRMPIMIGIYSIILKPLTYLTNIGSDVITAAENAYSELTGKAAGSYIQPEVYRAIKEGVVNIKGTDTPFTFEGFAEAKAGISHLDFDFFGIDLSQSPEFNIDIFNKWDNTWIIPILAFAAAMLSSIFSMIMQKKNNPEAPSMGGLMLTMPLISLIIGFTVSCAAGFYWACSSLVAGIIQVVLQKFYGPHQMIANEQKKELLARFEIEKKKKQKVENA